MSDINYLKLIKDKLNSLPKKKMAQKEQDFIQHYLGTRKKNLGIKIAEIIKIANDITKKQNEIPPSEMTILLNKLFSANTFEEHAIAGKIFTLLKAENRTKIPFSQIEKWLKNTHGWVEVDVICQSSFTAPEVLARWDGWQKTIKKFAKSENIQLRRASLVLQNVSLRKTDDKKVRQLAFATIDQLKSEKDILITKAVSWLLRSLTILDKEEVRQYLIRNESTLRRIAFRETMKKITTGKK